ncbi:MAG TPA: flagellar biosynthesis protein FliQ [Xanthomonadaceae bacterium]|nr:flagellar biosynthesis protein FliQ [Xanthomonadaceae bacterium]
MDSDFAMRLLSDTLIAAVKVAGPFLVAALVIGLLISILQVVTQIQEMTLTFVPKMIVILLSLILFLPFMLQTLISFTHDLTERIISG